MVIRFLTFSKVKSTFKINSMIEKKAKNHQYMKSKYLKSASSANSLNRVDEITETAVQHK